MIDFGQTFFAVDFEFWHFPVIFLAGLIGESFGALVGGGSILTMPALLLTGIPIQSAIAVDNAAAIGTEAGILTETHRKVMASKKWVVLLAVPLTLGGVLGTWLLLNVPGTIIKYLMAATVIFILIHTHLTKKSENGPVSKKSYTLIIAFLFLIGIYSNFMAAGEGAFSRMGLMSILGWSFLRSQGIKAMATMPSRIYSLVVTGFAGLIVWPYLLTMWCGGFIAGKYSTRFVKKIPDKYMKNALTIISLGFVIYLLFFYE